MEESKELQGFYKIFRSVIYISILMEFFEYAIDPAMLDHWGITLPSGEIQRCTTSWQ